ncbi:rhoptry protein ROP14 [Toxoplasma gondii FOU]|uniref:Rhoptry protein ROP14 n=2 Tax=Toxoplasma gondii TaxID=5811 RepID=A0A086LI60_TOXGO|nr:rhoptry protein ROP14 [Toxoplasma gondii FOU]PUA86596.1 rhoptry protein ROP14 [Toxoplasma gondii TgCATBr9]
MYSSPQSEEAGLVNSRGTRDESGPNGFSIGSATDTALKAGSPTGKSWKQLSLNLGRRVWDALDPTWSCAEKRRRLDPETLRKLKSTYWLSRIVFLRALGFVYFFAFLIAFNQSQGLIGSDGILPASDYVAMVKDSFADAEAWQRVKAFPSLFLLFPATDFWLHAIPFVGMILSLFMTIQGASNGFLLFLLWILYQTVNSVGQAWFSVGWEAQLLELGFLAIWMAPFWSLSRLPPSWPTPKICVWGNRWLVFRVMLGSGLIKLRTDRAWKDLTALDYHYETQPLPNPLSWYFQNQSHGVHAAQVVITHIVECVISFLVILPFRQCRLFAGIVQIAFQVGILLSGNLAFLNYLTIVSAIMCLDDHFLTCLFPSAILSRLPELVRGCAGYWSLPQIQAWPFPQLFPGEEHGKGKGRQANDRPEAEASLLDKDAGRDETLPFSAATDDSLDSPRSCCCWYRPYFPRIVRSLKIPSRVRKQVKEEIKENWGKMLAEVVASVAMLTCMAFVTNPATSAVWMVIAVFFLAIILSASSTFFTNTLVSNAFTELVLLIVTLWSCIAIYQHGPAVWSVWLTTCLFTVLIAFAYTTLTNAALIFKIHVEVLIFLLIAALSVPVVANLISPDQVMDSDLGNPFSVVNTHGAFGYIGKERYELIIQGTNASSPTQTLYWQNYEFKCKPGDLYRRPCWAAPYHYRLDWLMWLASMGDKETVKDMHPWLSNFLSRLLQNSKSVTGLLAHNPFQNSDPPTALRVLRIQYRFTKGPVFGGGPWWEVVPETRELFVAPSQVPGAAAHLRKQLLILRRREEKQRLEQRRKEEAEIRRKEEEAFKRRRERAMKEEERRKREAEEAEKRRIAEQARQAEDEKRIREQAEAARKAEEEAVRKQIEEEKKRHEEEEKERQAEEERERREQQEEEEKRRAEDEKRRKEKEQATLLARQRSEEALKEAEKKARKDAEEEERKRKEDALQEEKRQKEEKEAEEKRRKQAEARREAARAAAEKESEKARQLQEQEAKRKELEEQERRKARERQRSASSQVAVYTAQPHDGGGVPLRHAPLLTRKKQAL